MYFNNRLFLPYTLYYSVLALNYELKFRERKPGEQDYNQKQTDYTAQEGRTYGKSTCRKISNYLLKNYLLVYF